MSQRPTRARCRVRNSALDARVARAARAVRDMHWRDGLQEANFWICEGRVEGDRVQLCTLQLLSDMLDSSKAREHSEP